MSPRLQTEGQTQERCPQCAALVRPDAHWCTLCYADLRPAPPSATLPPSQTLAPSAAVPPSDIAITPPDAAGPATSAQGWPCQRCGGVVAIEKSACTHCGAGFLQGGDDTDPVLRRLRGGLDNQVKVAIMVGGAAVLLLVIFGIGYLVHAVF